MFERKQSCWSISGSFSLVVHGTMANLLRRKGFDETGETVQCIRWTNGEREFGFTARGESTLAGNRVTRTDGIGFSKGDALFRFQLDIVR